MGDNSFFQAFLIDLFQYLFLFIHLPIRVMGCIPGLKISDFEIFANIVNDITGSLRVKHIIVRDKIIINTAGLTKQMKYIAWCVLPAVCTRMNDIHKEKSCISVQQTTAFVSDFLIRIYIYFLNLIQCNYLSIIIFCISFRIRSRTCPFKYAGLI